MDGGKRPLKGDTFELCTVPPKRPDGQTIWTLGDSHAGQLQALLAALHDRTGMGVHLIETPGVAFPMMPGNLFEPRQRIYNSVAERLRPGDIVLLGRLFLSRNDNGMFAGIPEWSAEAVKLAEQLADRKVNLVVFGPPPMFHFNTLLSCWRARSVCEIDRIAAAKRIEPVQHILRNLALKSNNIYIFDSFAKLCPAGAVTCSPFKGGQAIFHDRDHLNSVGAAGLADDFLAFLKSDGLLAENE